MRRGTIIVGVAAGVDALSGAAAPASTLPLAIRFDQGTVAVGTFPTAPAATAAAPATFRGTIDVATFAASFPASSITLPDAVVERVDYGTPYGSGRFVVHAVPEAFTGSANGSGSIDLRGLVAYDLVATTAQGTFTCVSDTPAPLTLAGTAIMPATGAYGVSGEQISLVVMHPEHPQDPLEGALCASQAQKVSPGAPVRSVFAGTKTVPGSILTPTGAPLLRRRCPRPPRLRPPRRRPPPRSPAGSWPRSRSRRR